MRSVISIVMVLNVLASALILANAASAIHEILAAVAFLAAAVLLGALGVMRELREMQSQLRTLIHEAHMARPTADKWT